MRALGEAATHLPWLSPCAASLLALARASADTAWEQVRRDPGAVLLVVRQTAAALASPALSFYPPLLRDPSVLEGALALLHSPLTTHHSPLTTHSDAAADGPVAPGLGFVDWSQPAARPIYAASLTYARLAERIAEVTGRCDPDNAWVAGLLVPLGWMALCAVDAAAVADCLADPLLAVQSVTVQQRRWGLDQAGIARRLLRAWQVPRWLAAVVGHLGLPAETAMTLGADPFLFHVVRLAVAWAEQRGTGLHIPIGGPLAQALEALELAVPARDLLQREADALVQQPPAVSAWTAPERLPLLRDLLQVAAENRRLRGVPAVEQLEQDRDQLHQALAEHHAAEATRLQQQKLGALAEFAAGAGHEINNPLAVISGQAQYLLGHEADPSRQRSLQKIVGQTQRIHQILNELMQFARPPRPQKQLIDLPELLRQVADSLAELAEQRKVRLLCPSPQHAVSLHGDPGQLHTALSCLLRNAIEAAPPEGWARVRVELAASDRVHLIVEDSGPGPTPAQREHLFDPFYSGRLAGRGKGLGLPTAWRLAREHGGDVRFDSTAEGPTRFLLSLPLEPLHLQGPHFACTPAHSACHMK